MADYCVWMWSVNGRLRVWVWSDNGRRTACGCGVINGRLLRWVWSDYRMLVWQGWSLQHTVLRATNLDYVPLYSRFRHGMGMADHISLYFAHRYGIFDKVTG